MEGSSAVSTIVNHVMSPFLLAFIHGTIVNDSPVSKLRGHQQILLFIWKIVCEEWIDLQIDRFPVNNLKYDLPELLQWPQVDDIVTDIYQTYNYPRHRQICAGCPVAVIEKNISFPPVTCVPPNVFHSQIGDALYVHMMPFDLDDRYSLPLACRQYWPLIQLCLRFRGDLPKIGYLTIDERALCVETAQGQSGLQIESLCRYDGHSRGIYIPGLEQKTGGGVMIREESVTGGVFMASNMAHATCVWNCRTDVELGLNANLKQYRDQLGPYARTLDAGELIWMTDRTPHESLPIPASGGSQRRQYFRLVVGEVSAWFADHSTPNPLGTVPPSNVRVVKGRSNTQYPTLSKTLRWHCGSPDQLRSARALLAVRKRLYEFNLGHIYERVVEYGLTSVEEIVRVFELQGGVRGITTSLPWNLKYSATGDAELFPDHASRCYEMAQFAAMVSSL